MLPAAPYLLPVPMLYLIYKYLRTGGTTELSEVRSVSLKSGASNGDSPHRNNDSQTEPSDPDFAIHDELRKLIRKLDPADLNKIGKLHPDFLDEIQKIDPGILDENWKFDPDVLDQRRKSCLEENKEGGQEAERSCNRRETETQDKRENVNEKQIEESDGGGKNTNENSDEVEKKVVDEGSSRKGKYPTRSAAGDCMSYLKTGTCKFGSNCKFNHHRRRKKNQISTSGGPKNGTARSRNNGVGPSVAPTQKLNFLGLPIRPTNGDFGPASVSEEKKKESVESAVKPGTDHEISTSGGPKNGKARSRNNGVGPSVASTQKLNFLGLPIRPTNGDFGPASVSKEKKKESVESAVKPGTDHEISTSGGPKNGKARSRNNGVGPSVAPTQKLNFLGLPIRPTNGDFGPASVSKEKKKESVESAVKLGTDHEISTSGGPKNGKARSRNNGVGPSVAPTQKLNFLGLPIRPGKKECPYYMRNASCIHGTRCWFTHPDPTAAGEPELPSGGTDGPPPSEGVSAQMAAPWSSSSSLNDALPSQGFSSQNTEWNSYQALEYLPERNMPTLPPVDFNSVTETNIYNQYPRQQQVEEFPERPEQPLCSNFLRTRRCKYKSNCKFDHPKTQTAASPSSTLSDKVLPLKPNICTQYSHYGLCNSGATCPFDHPSLSTSFCHSATTNEAGSASWEQEWN